MLTGSQGSEQPAYGYNQPPGFGQPPAYGQPPGYAANPYGSAWRAGGAGGTKRRVYFLLFVAVTQPLLSWWLTYHLVLASPPLAPAR